MENFCESEFWDSSATWNATSHPDFFPCFEKTILVSIPCFFLWFLAPFYGYSLRNSKDKDIPWSGLNVSKLIISIVIIFDLCFLLFKQVYEGTFSQVYGVDYYFPTVLLATMTLQLTMIILEKKRGIQSSWYMFLFWFLMGVCEAFQFRTNIFYLMDGSSNDQTGSLISFMIFYVLVVCMLILNCFADKQPQYIHLARGENACPELNASFISRITFTWLNGLIWRGYRQPITQDILWDLPYNNTSSKVTQDWEKHSRKRNQKSKPEQVTSYVKNGSYVSVQNAVTDSKDKSGEKREISVFSLLVRAFGLPFFFGSLIKLIHDLIQFAPPLILSALISYSEDMSQPTWRGYFFALLLLSVTSLQSLMLSQYFIRMFSVGLNIRTAVIAAIYKKALLMSNSARKETTVGEIVNLMSVDAQRFVELVPYLNLLWSAPLQIALSIYFLWNILGPSVLAGLAVMVVMVPSQGFVATKQKTLQINQMKQKDQRIKCMNEILNGIKVLKLYAWEEAFEEQILNIRNKEAKELRKTAYLNAGSSFFWNCIPFMVSLASFAVYTAVSDKPLDSKTAFVSITLFDLLRFPISALPMMISQSVQASVSVKRMDKFLNSDELDLDAVNRNSTSSETPIIMEDGYFAWGGEEDDQSTLKNINLKLKRGTLVGVVGSVGAGKSSLCSAILGEMKKISGSVTLDGSVAYVPQQAWIQNATVKENILFGKTFHKKLYERVIDACALKSDLAILSAGDETEIGEKGINLSGGQKQRINLARAVFNNASIYLLDDPLSAVDSHVGKHIFENVIGPNGLLKDQTRLLVTHSLTYLRHMDHIVVMTDGEISEQGTYKELLNDKGKFQEFLIQYLVEQEEIDDVIDGELEELKTELSNTIGRKKVERQLSVMSQRRKRVESESNSMDKKSNETSSISLQRMKSISNDGDNNLRKGSIQIKKEETSGLKIIEVEKAETGKVSFSVYSYYIKAVGIVAASFTFLFTFAGEGLSVGSSIWLSKWSEDKNSSDADLRNYYLGIYGGIRSAQTVCIFCGALILYHSTLSAAVSLHRNLLLNIMRLPMTFFDTNPLGRILNRFSKDIDTMDSVLPFTTRFMVLCLAQVVSTFTIISYTTPYFIIVMIPLMVVYYFVQLIYVSTSRQLRRIESISRSPIFSHFGETVQGAATIRAYKKEKQFILDSQRKVDLNQVSYYPGIVANRWLAIRLEFIGNLLTFSAAIFVVMSRETTTGGDVGLAISYALSVTQTLNWLVRMTSDLETNIVAVERVKEYTETPQEAPRHIVDKKPSETWPQKGVVDFENYAMRYREGLDLVIKEINCHINEAEKIGIVGRTGAGKSSLTLALFRIIESAEGTIKIDGVDLSQIGLHDLRKRLTIIPQDPVLFSGTLRMNFDPANQYSDEQVWNALEHSHLKDFVSKLDAKLNHEVAEGGENISVGQRQLVCLARALLRKTKVLVLDEATAAVDLETDDLIQKTIKTEFKDSTVITIAHRLNTIMDSSRVIVLDKGEICEFDTPTNLLRNEFSIFYGMAKDAGIV